MDLDWTERLYRLGGFVAQYANAAEGFVQEARRTAALRDTYGAGYGYGSDMNGVGGWPGPVGEDAANAVRYPFTSADGGSVLERQVTGERIWDLNTDGLAHNGLLPDWIEQIRLSGGGAQDVVDDLLRGAESYLGTWRAAERHHAGTNLAAGAPATASSTQWWNLFADHRAAGPSTGTGRPAGPASGATTSGSGSTWAPSAASTGSSSTGSGPTPGSTASRCPPTGPTGAPCGRPPRATEDSTRPGSTPPRSRFVRLHGLRRATDWGYSVHEMGVYRSR